MNFLKKIHKLVGQNEQIVKKPHKHDTNLQNNSTLYFQVGLILTLLASYGLFEMNFENKLFKYTSEPVDDTETIYFVNIVPEVIPEQVTKTKIEPVRKKLLAIKFKPINDKTQIISKKVVPTIAINTPKIGLPKKKKDGIVPKKPRNILTVGQVPIYPGCEDFSSNNDLRQCMSKKIARLVQRKFNTDLAESLGLTGRQNIYVQFKIDKSGNVSEIEASAKHIKLKNEAIRVVDKIPQMIPGKEKDKIVEVMYSLPIVFVVRD